MASFADRTGKRWDLELTLGKIDRIKSVYGQDWLAPSDSANGSPPPLMAVGTDPRLPLCYWWELAGKEQVPNQGDWLDLFDGPAIQACAEAWLEAVADFTQGHRGKELRTLMTEQRRLAEGLSETAVRTMPGVVDELLAIASGTPSGNPPASLESTPAATAPAS